VDRRDVLQKRNDFGLDLKNTEFMLSHAVKFVRTSMPSTIDSSCLQASGFSKTRIGERLSRPHLAVTGTLI
jgi:hypothetical protein